MISLLYYICVTESHFNVIVVKVVAIDATAIFLTMKKGNHFPFLKKKNWHIKVEKETFEYTCQQVRIVFEKNTIPSTW